MSTEQLTKKFGVSGLKGGKAEEWLFNKLNTVYDEVIDLSSDDINIPPATIEGEEEE